MKKLGFLALALLIALPSVFAQTAGGGRRRVVEIDVVVSVNVANASVSVNKQAVPAPFPATIKLAPGSYTVEASAPGYDRFSATVAVEEKSNTINITLVPSKVAVNFTTNVPGAMLTLDKQSVKLPTTLQLLPGNYSFSASAVDHEAYAASVLVNAGAPVTVAVNLNPSQATMRTGDLTVFINGQAMPAGEFTVKPGRQKVKITLGSRVIGEKDVVFKPNVLYDISLITDFTVTETRVGK